MDKEDAVCWTVHYEAAAPKGQRCELSLDHRGPHKCGAREWWVIFESGKWICMQ
jgi:hypothetical protein